MALVGYDPGFALQCVRSWWTHPDIVAYDNMADDQYQSFSGKHRKLSTEVELNSAGQVFAAQLGLPGQAYRISSRFDATPATPAYFDFTGGTHGGANYEATLGWDFALPRFRPIATGAFQWAGLCDYQDQGGGTAFGTGIGSFTTAQDFKINPRVDTNGGTPNLYRVINGLLFSYPASGVLSGAVTAPGSGYVSNGLAGTALQPKLTITGGGGTGATGHVVIGTGAQAGQIVGIVIDTPGEGYTSNPTLTITTTGAGSGATATGAYGTYPFFGAVDFNFFVSTGFPKDAIYTAASEPKVRACVQGMLPSYYGFASVDASSYSIALAADNAWHTTANVTWGTGGILTYLTTTVDKKVGAINGSTPNASSATHFMPAPLGGLRGGHRQGRQLRRRVQRAEPGEHLRRGPLRPRHALQQLGGSVTYEVIEGDCLEVMRGLPDCSVDLIVTSPPYAKQRKTTYGGIEPDAYVDWFLPIPTLTAFATLNGVPLSPGPLLSVLGGEIVMTEVGGFNKSSIVCAGSDRRAILAMQPWTLVEVVQDGVGTIAYGYVIAPRQQVSDNGDSTITLELEPLVRDAMRRRLHRGWQVQGKLSVVAYRLGTFAPGWSGGYRGRGRRRTSRSPSPRTTAPRSRRSSPSPRSSGRAPGWAWTRTTCRRGCWRWGSSGTRRTSRW
jgi:hypothetical protein